MAFGKSKIPSAGAPVTDITDWMVKSSLQHEQVTLALSRFENPWTTKGELGPYDAAVATGLVHFETGTDRVIRADLTFREDLHDARPGSIGGAYVHMKQEGNDNQFVVFSIEIYDPRGKLASKLQDAFHCGAVSNNRFVHVNFTRPNIEDVPAVMIELGGGRGNAYHPITEMFIRRETILPQAPGWAWAWRRY